MKTVHVYTVFVLVLLVCIASGCVSQGTYDALQKEHDALKSNLERCQGELGTCQGQRSAALLQAEGLGQEVERLEQQNQELTTRLGTVLKDNAQLDASIDEMREALTRLNRSKADAEARIAEYKSLVERFRDMIDAGKLRVKIVDGRMVVELATDILFASGSSALSKQGKEAIEEVTQILKEIEGRDFQVEGHTDNVPMKGGSNWELAASRAMAVVRTMLGAGLSPQRVSAASYGEHKPTASNDDANGRQANRRIEIVIIPDLSRLPGFEQLQRLSN